MTRPAVLLTLDEARDLLGSSALALVESLAASTSRLPRLLAGKGSTRALPAPARDAVRAHRAALRQVRDAGHGWILDEQVEGALGYADCVPSGTALHRRLKLEPVRAGHRRPRN